MNIDSMIFSGPELASKYSYECRSCPKIFNFRGKLETYDRVSYQVDQYGNKTMGFKKYDNSEIVRSTGEELFTREFLRAYMNDLLINFTSSEGRAESYNLSQRGSERQKFFEQFISANPGSGGHFQRRLANSDDIFDEEDAAELSEEPQKDNCPEKSTMHLLGRKNLSTGFYNHELICELEERGQLQNSFFGPKADPKDESKSISYKASIEQMMKEIETVRREELYTHKECAEACRSRGCGQVKLANDINIYG